MMIKLNKELIVSIRIFIEQEHPDYYYREPYKFLFKTYGGYFEKGYLGRKIISIPDILADGRVIVKDKKVLWLPHIKITTADGRGVFKYFATKRELYTYIENNLSHIQWLNIESLNH